MDVFRDVCQTRSQQRFYLGLSTFLQIAIFIYSVVITGIGLHVLLVVTDNIGPILDEDAEHVSIGISMELLSGFILAIGFCNAFVCTSFPYILYVIYNVENNKLHRKKIFTMVISQIILGFGVLFLGIICLLQRSHLDENMQAAIINALPYYRSRMELKTAIDKMQIYYQCCGGKSPSDWFEIEWYRKISIGQQKIIHNAPFSCCNRYTMTPCLSPADVAMLNMDLKKPLKDIWYTQGCAEAINKTLSQLLMFPVGVISLIFFGLQLFGTSLSYLILSVMNEEKPKQKFQKLHFDIENFDHDHCDLDQHPCESSSTSEDETSAFRRVVLQSPHYDRFPAAYTTSTEKQEKKAIDKARKQTPNRHAKVKGRKVNKKENKKKDEADKIREVDDIAVEEVPIITPILQDEAKDNEHSDANTDPKDTSQRQVDCASNDETSKNTVIDADVFSVDGGVNKADTMSTNIGASLNTEEKGSENDISETGIHTMDNIRIMGEQLQRISIDDDIGDNEEPRSEHSFDFRGELGASLSLSRLSIDST